VKRYGPFVNLIYRSAYPFRSTCIHWLCGGNLFILQI